jgi:hypothetical protein
MSLSHYLSLSSRLLMTRQNFGLSLDWKLDVLAITTRGNVEIFDCPVPEGGAGTITLTIALPLLCFLFLL